MTLHLQARVPERGVELDLTVSEGETLALIGPNGAGKSTVLSLVSGALRPAHGRVELGGELLLDERSWTPPHRRRVTTLGQDPVLFPHLSARGNVMFALRSQGAPRARAREEAGRWLAELGVEQVAERRPAQLSGGQAQRVAIARALAADPRLLLLDEPMAALDIDVATALRAQLRHYLGGRTAVVVTHDVLDVLTLADRVAVLEAGRILEQGPAKELMTRPRTSFAARFAGLNLVTGHWQDSAVVLADGSLLPAPGPHPPGRRLHAAFRPSAVRLAESDGIPRTLTGLEPHGDLIRVRTEDIAADLSPQDVAARGLGPGTRVHLTVPLEAVTPYEA